MKQKTSTLSKKITGYSSMAASLLAISNLASAQIVYTDVNPDFADANNGAEYGLDLNNDATVDFKVTITSNGGAGVRMVAEVLNDNAIAGTYNTAYPYIYPSALDLNDIIDENKTWNDGAPQTMASTGYFQGAYGEWFGASDKYMGLRLAVGTNVHYGWVRMDVAENGKSFVVKDYAYESTPDAAIAAGDAGSIGITPVNAAGYKVFAANQVVHVQLKNTLSGDVTITNLLGQIIKQVEISSNVMTLDMAGEAGSVYMVTVRQNGEVFTQKVVL
ncbi:MAG TPA: T9SS type A sorting domain-containing protein [Chitinophagales bacterium]|nr:T9SS type A sorting domain-containing protein [Chitinophagales bacterium]